MFDLVILNLISGIVATGKAIQASVEHTTKSRLEQARVRRKTQLDRQLDSKNDNFLGGKFQAKSSYGRIRQASRVGLSYWQNASDIDDVDVEVQVERFSSLPAASQKSAAMTQYLLRLSQDSQEPVYQI